MSILRGILSVVAGYVFTGVVVVALTLAIQPFLPDELDALRGAQVWPWRGLMLAYSAAAAVAGGYLTALLAHRAPVAHATALGALILAIGVATTVVERERVPVGFNVTLAVVGGFGAAVGGHLRSARTGPSAQSRLPREQLPLR